MKFLNVDFEKSTFTIFLKYLQKEEVKGKILISDLDIDCLYYDMEVELNQNFDAWAVPFNEKLKNIVLSNSSFSGVVVKLYNDRGRLLQSEDIVVNPSSKTVSRPYFTPEFDVTGPSYIDFFYGDLCKGIDTSGVVIDAGANVGFFTLYVKETSLNNKRVYSIEPDPLPYFYLEKNFKKDKDVILLNKALSGTGDYVKFDMSLGGSVGSAMSKYSNYEYKKTILIDSLRVYDILKIEGRINLLKLDIEGAEFEVLKQLSKYEFNRIDQMFIEFHADPKEIEKALLENKYEVEYRDSDKNDTVGFIYAKKI